jgi:hypothetical protein
VLRQIFYALLGGYFAAGLLIGLNWLSAIDLHISEPTVAPEPGLAPVEGNRTPGAESAHNTDVTISQALTSQRKSSDDRNFSAASPPVAVLELSPPDRTAASGRRADTGELGMRRPRPSRPDIVKSAEPDRASLPTVRAIDQASIPQPRTDRHKSTSMPQIRQPA